MFGIILIISNVYLNQNIMKSRKLFPVSSLLILIILLVAIVSCHHKEQPPKSEDNIYSQMELRGNVKSVTESDYRTKNTPAGIERGEMLSKYKFLFSPDRKLMEEIQYNSDGKLIWQSVYKWDTDGKLTEKVTYLDSVAIKNKIVYHYDNLRNLTEEISYDYKDSVEYRITYKYDGNGFNTEKLIYRPAEKNWNIAIDYNEDKKIEKTSFYSVTEPQVTRFFYKYDIAGNSVEEVYIRHDGSRGSRNITIYDEAGRKAGYEMYGSDDSLIYKSVYKFDEYGKLVERMGGSSKSAISVEEKFKYDSNGNLIESVNYSGPIISKTINEYLKTDTAGNWLIRRIIITSAVGGKRFSYIETEREIEYY